MTDSGKAVFLSYASQDAEAAKGICEALRAAGVEVWFDQSELRGGDTWDALIRQKIKACYLFVPIISANTQSREEGYFRREWNLAVARTLDMAGGRAFLLPIVIDGISDSEALVPEKFREVQWTRLPPGANPDAFALHVRRLVFGQPSTESSGAGANVARDAAAASVARPPQTAPSAPSAPSALTAPSAATAAAPAARGPRRALVATAVVVLLGLGILLITRGGLTRQGAEVKPPAQSAAEGAAEGAAASAFKPPPHSIAVLPFENLSADKDQEYFSDGLTEELLNSLAEIEGLQVVARTSSFSFKGTNTDIGTIAHKLNVGTVLEGSVRRSARTLRITTQLINAVTGFQLWSKTYDRDTGDILKLQTEIATAVAGAMKVTLLGDIASKIELGGTANPAAFDAYLRGAKLATSNRDVKDLPAAIAAFTEAIRLDPRYALAYAERSMTFSAVAGEAATPADGRATFEKARADAQQALKLAPDLAQAHLALAVFFDNTLNSTQADDEYERAMAIAPGDAQVLRLAGAFAAFIGRSDAGIQAIRRAVVLDPLGRNSHVDLGQALYYSRRYEEALAALSETISLDPEYRTSYLIRGLSFYALGDLDHARTSCETKPDSFESQWCLAVVYDKLGRPADAKAELAKIRAASGDASAYQYATIYAQWGDRAQALDWLETAWRLQDPGLGLLKTDPLLDPLRREPRFQAVERQLKFPG